ncbi:MAG: S8 family serine peptidase [Trueperaceae bacterium]|nr:S8 family serine peptidase [Trueperaceae bacterium]
MKKLINCVVMVRLLIIFVACSNQTTDPTAGEPFSYTIDETIELPTAELPGLNGGAARPVAAFKGPTGETRAFVENEVMMQPKSEANLQAFLKRYNGKILRDGMPFLLPEVAAELTELLKRSGWYLIQVDLNRSVLDDLTSNLQTAGFKGDYRFSSEAAAHLASLAVREANNGVVANAVWTASAVPEHPNGTGNLNAEDWWWMSEDDGPYTDGEQGLSVGVIHAWDYLEYKNIPAENDTWIPPVLAIIDGGFAIDEVTGLPLNDNQDYFYFGDHGPMQIDLIEFDDNVGNPSPEGFCAVDCPWHGSQAFGVAAARPKNFYGGAGTGGPVAIPMLIRVENTAYSVADAIRTAVLNKARIISISIAGDCNVWDWICTLPPNDIKTVLESSVALADSLGAIVVAAAGNESTRLTDDEFRLPCSLKFVICVGAMERNKMAAVYSNYGTPLDIWAPVEIYSTVIPDTADKTGADAICCFNGTSAATPFIAGVVALMKALNPQLRWEDAEQILKTTANSSPDPKITAGYIDAYLAVKQASPNEAPVFLNPKPEDNIELQLKAPFRFDAHATDPEGASDSTSVTITVLEPPENLAPDVIITNPENGLRLTSISEALALNANVNDPENDTPLNYEWRASIINAPFPETVVIGSSQNLEWIPQDTFTFDGGFYLIRLSLIVTDVQGNIGSDVIQLEVLISDG